MKTISKLLFGLAALTFAAVSCVNESEPYSPGEPEEAGCYGVYFPTQVAGGAFEPSDTFQFEVKVCRTVDEDAITVPIEVKGAGAKYVNIAPVAFNIGQTEATTIATFSDTIPQNKEFAVTFEISNNKFASKYSTKPSFVAATIVVESWKLLGTGNIWDYWMGGDEVTYPVQIYQNGADTNKYRVANIFDEFINDPAIQDPDLGWGGWTGTPDKNFEFRVLQVGEKIFEGKEGMETTISKNDLILYDAFKSGILYQGSPAYPVMYYHPCYFYSQDEKSWTNNRVDNWQDPDKEGHVIPSVVYVSPFRYMVGLGGWDHSGNTEKSLVIQFPGGVFVDYTLDVEIGTTEAGVAPVEFTCGKDVTNVVYAIYQGELTAKEIRSKKALIAAGEEPAADSLDMETKAFGFQADTTSLFTIVAVAYDKNSKEQNNINSVFGYVKLGEERKVVAGASAHQLTDSYLAHDYDSTSCLIFNAWGKDIKSAQIGFIPKAVYDTLPAENRIEYTVELEEENIEKVNEVGGFTAVWEGLAPFTEYVFVYYAFNGYEQSFYSAEAMTCGLPLQHIGTGTYYFGGKFFSGAQDELEFVYDPNNDIYEILNWAGYANLCFEETGDTTVYVIPFGITGSYGAGETSWYFDGYEDYAAQKGYDLSSSYFCESDTTYYFNLTYFNPSSFWGPTWEAFHIDSYEPAEAGATSVTAAAKTFSYSNAKMDSRLNPGVKIPLKPARKYTEVKAANRTVEAASYNTVKLEKSGKAQKMLSKPFTKAE